MVLKIWAIYIKCRYRKINVINKLYRTFHLVIETWLVCQPQDSSDPNQVLVLQQYKQACVIRPHLFCS